MIIYRHLTTKLGLLTVSLGLVTIFLFLSLQSCHKQSNLFQQPSISQSHPIKLGKEENERSNERESEEEENSVISSKKILCGDTISESFLEQRGDYWVLSNYFQASKSFHCDESITYTTHAEYSYLDNLMPLVERWQGPVSITVYTPGWDFRKAVKVIAYLRECSDSSFIKDFVTFHLFFDKNRLPKQKIQHNSTAIKANCKYNPSKPPVKGTYRQLAKLTYPVNMARMIARDLATTHYVLASDIELYPNPGVIHDFLDMIVRNDPVLRSPNPKVFVLPIFEADELVPSLPVNKNELVEMLEEGSVIPFHKNVCPRCHSIPDDGHTNWTEAPFDDGYMNIYHVAKRQGKYKFWEPIYIGTRSDPMYDIRLHWEGQRDKMTQGYILCVLDYEFHILDNAFLIHRPGIKHISDRSERQKQLLNKQLDLIRSNITKELIALYGRRKGCALP